MSLNKKIIDIHEKNSLKPASEGEVFTYALFYSCLSIILIGSILIYINLFEQTAELIRLIMAVILCFIPVITMPELQNFKLDPLEAFFYLLHYILPRRKNRNLEIKAFIDSQTVTITELNSYEMFTQSHMFFKVVDVQAWLKENVSDVKSVLKLCHQRSIYKDSSVNIEFLYWTQLVPKIENVDVLRQVLMASKVSDESEVEDLPYISRELITDFFKLYKDTDLLRLFTSPLSIYDYCEVLKIARQLKLELPIETNMRDLYTSVVHLQKLSEKSDVLFKTGSLTDGRYEGMNLKQVRSVRELYDLGVYMKNCISSKEFQCIKAKTEIYTLSRNLKPMIVFEYRKNRMIEAKKRFNEGLTKDEVLVLDRIIKGSRI